MVRCSMGEKRTASRRGMVRSVNVTFYGVRGSCPCSGDRYRRYGGNTSCLVLDIEGDDPLIVDLGTGLRALGDVLQREVRAAGDAAPRDCAPHPSPLRSHLGDPILRPPARSRCPAHRLRAGPTQGNLKDALHAAVQPPVFPIHMEQFRGELITVDVGSEDFSVGTGQGDGSARTPQRGDAGIPDRGRGPLGGLHVRSPGAAGPPGDTRRRCSSCARASTS